MVHCAKYFVILLWIRILHNAVCMQRLASNYWATIIIVHNSTTRLETLLTTDGNKSTDASACFMSEHGTEGRWQIYLGYDHIIERIQITNVIGENVEQSKMQLAGFAVYVTTDRRVLSALDKCYQDINKNLPELFQNQTCIGYGRYVTIMNKRPPIAEQVPGKDYSKSIAFELCEVEIFGCRAGYYGQNCEDRCPYTCSSNRCFSSNGTCMDGCKPGHYGGKCNKKCNCKFFPCERVHGTCTSGGCRSGWQGDSCDVACSHGYYGDECRSKCGNCAGDATCNHVTGACTGRCLPGWRNSKCNEECQKGFYGEGCGKYCSYCSSQLCNKETGECQNGCVAGWEGNTCDKRCQSGMYGPGCKLPCRNCAHGNACNHIDGRCTFGCSAGYMGERCEAACQSGRFGSGCSSYCGHCADGRTCNSVNGRCTNGCSSGYKGDHCKTECQSGMYGPGCKLQCRNCAHGNTCNHIDGRCTFGCSAGYMGERCETACQSGRFGSGCSSYCGHCADGRTCNRVNGRCTNGCSAGYRGDHCKTVCQSGMYGPGCKLPCRNCAHGNTCNHIDGRCTFGCSAGYMGDRCETACQSGRFGSGCSSYCGHCAVGRTCNHVNGRCTNGCSAGYRGDHCKTVCQSGMYGPGCKLPCRNCAHGNTCNHIDGRCTIGCSAGYMGDRCETGCDAGKYGSNCKHTCGHCKNGKTCHHVNGSCTDGCAAGYRGDQCTKKCVGGTYGVGCSQTCGHCRGNKMCHNVHGNCSSGCLSGWKGEKCDTKCDPGYYGNSCKKLCGNCDGSSCNFTNGHCTCLPGWKGDRCDERCIEGQYGTYCTKSCGNCHEGSCHFVTGTCTNGCLDGWIGDKCDEKCLGPLFGKNCLKKCGKCAGEQGCHHINGSCPEGCLNGWDGDLCTKHIKEAQNTSSVVIPVVVCVLCLLIAAVVVYLFIWRRRKTAVMGENSIEINTSNETSSRGMITNAVQMSVVSPNFDDKDVQENENVEYANHSPKRGMMVSELPRFIVSKSQKNRRGFVEEYQKLPKGPVLPHEEGKHSNNKIRNRFANTFPYDHSRVILKGPQNYINASYIDSLEQSSAYIASQGPKKNTLTDFWQMIWQENVCKIVMLANCIEDGKAKVEQYWPEVGDIRKIGEFNISNQSETEYSAYIIKNLRVINNKNGTTRVVKHFHFTRWPDHGIPEIVRLIMFHKHVYTAPTTLNGPVVVHCSAGVGRTGTYIALDALTHQGVQTGFVDVFEYVDSIRKNRMDMVQTVEQYQAVHSAIYEGCLFYGSRISAEEFLTKNDSIVQSDFQKLQSLRPSLDESSCSEASKKENCKKNKDMSILPSDTHRPYLNSVNQARDYINAVILPSVTDQNGYFVTQWPMYHTAVDFWTLVHKYQSTALVILDSDKDTKSPDLVPSVESDVISVGPYSIQSAKLKVLHDTILKTELKVTKQDNQHHLTAFRVKYWPHSDTTPLSDFILRDLCLEVMTEQQSLQQPGPVTVTCSNGSSKCGMYCTVANAIESVKVDGFLDAPQIVRQLQLRRPAFITDLKQYMTCINSIRNYCNDNCTQYVNA